MNLKIKFFLILALSILFSSCSFKAKTLANDPALNSDLLKRKATVSGPPPTSATIPPTNNLNTNPIDPEIETTSDSAEASDSAETEKNY